MSLVVTAIPAAQPSQLVHPRLTSSSSASPSRSASASIMAAAALPSLFLKHARGHSLEKNHDKLSPAAAAASSSSAHASSGPAAAAGGVVAAANGHAYGPGDVASTSSSAYSSYQHHQPHASTSTASSGSSIPSTASSSTSHSHSTAATTPGSSHGLSDFIRSGDLVYDGGPPPPAPLPSIGTRNYTVLKEVGDGSFGTVWLADWHSPLALPRSTGAPGPSSRPEYKGKRLVALKRMKKAFDGGWDECMKLKELKSLRSIPIHPNTIPLYDAFLLPSSRELYFVFECMEGNLYQLTKSRKGRPLAAGLVANLFHQMLAGLHHIHESGYFHRDMKPENLLITTTGLADYPPYVPPSKVNDPRWIDRPPEKDVVAVVKIADFGLARETKSKPPYTEYVSTRWYRAPEVLLRSRDYSNPVDMWAVGTILAEMVTLKPLFPGQSEVDQVFRICEVMGDPSEAYGKDERGRIRGGGGWERGIKMAKQVGFAFPHITPVNFENMFDLNLVPYQLVDIMTDLMRYEPKVRLTTKQCLDHSYFSQVAIYLKPTPVPSVPNHVLRQQHQQSPKVSISPSSSTPGPLSPSHPSPRDMPSSHSQMLQQNKPAFAESHASARPQILPQPSAASTHSGDPYYNPRMDRQLPALSPGHTAAPSPALSFSETIGSGDVSMSSDDTMHAVQTSPPSGRGSPVPSSTYSFGQGPSDKLPPVHHLPAPTPSYRQGANGYAASTHSGGSYYNPSVYSGGRRGSAGGASTFYDGSIFEGIAPTRAASILSFPATYGQAPPSPKFSQPASYNQAPNQYVQNLRHARKHSDNFSVDFEREALQRSQAAAQQNNLVNASSSNESLKASKIKDGKKGWMSSVFNSSSSSSQQPVYTHPQQQPLIHPANFPASPTAAASSGSSLKRTPSERSMHAAEQPPPQPQQPLDPKKAKKEAERLAKEAEKAKREAAQKAARDRARAVMQKRNALAQAADPLHNFGQHQLPSSTKSAAQLEKEKQRALLEAAARKQQVRLNGGQLPKISEGASMRDTQSTYSGGGPYSQYKARRRDDDDDVHSMSSTETRSDGRFSLSTANTTGTMDSDPGPSRPGRHGGLLPPMRRSPSIASFSGQSHLSVNSQGSSQYSRRDLSTSSSNTSSLEFGLVGRFQGLSAAEHDTTSQRLRSSQSPPVDGSTSPYYQPNSQYTQGSTFSPRQGTAASNGSFGSTGAPHQQHNISLPPIQSFDHPPKEFAFPHAPRSSHSQSSANSTISAGSNFRQQQPQLPFTPEMYRLHMQQQNHQDASSPRKQ